MLDTTDANYLAGSPQSYVGFREPLCEHMLTTSLVFACYLLGCDHSYQSNLVINKCFRPSANQ